MARIKKAQRGTNLKDYVNRSFKTADSLRYANPKLSSKGLKGILEERKSNRAKADSIEKAVEKRVGVPRKYNLYEQKNGGKVKKAKKGGSFPDLNKDGKITRADILKGRGVIKNGGKLKKARGGATLAPSKSSTSNRLASYGRPLGKNMSGKVKKAMGGMKMMKMGGKCRGGCY